MTALNLLQTQCTAKRGELILFDVFRDLIGIEDAPVDVKRVVKAAWLAAREAGATFPPAIRSAERRTRGNVIPFSDRGAKR